MIAGPLRVLAAPGVLALAICCGAYAQAPSRGVTVVGSVYIQNPGGFRPTPAVGYRIYIINERTKTYTGPSLTDKFGQFAFYGVTQDAYILRVYRAKARIFEEVISVTAANAIVRIAPIVLPSHS